jgi:hypothetical protein
VFDHWFEWLPSTSREEFSGRIGLDPTKPFLLYMCSSAFIAGKSEADYINRWIARVRRHPDLRDVGILVRPHPANLDAWKSRRLADSHSTALWDVEESVPISRSAKHEFYDSIFHAAGVVGLNTSSLIESSIIGRPVFTLVEEETRATQSETPHFALIAAEGGVLNVATSMAEHQTQLLAALSDPDYGRLRREHFIGSFVRPNGTAERSTGYLVAALEAQANRPKEPRRDATTALLGRAILAPLTQIDWPTQRERARLRKRRRSRSVLRRR